MGVAFCMAMNGTLTSIETDISPVTYVTNIFFSWDSLVSADDSDQSFIQVLIYGSMLLIFLYIIDDVFIFFSWFIITAFI